MAPKFVIVCDLKPTETGKFPNGPNTRAVKRIKGNRTDTSLVVYEVQSKHKHWFPKRNAINGYRTTNHEMIQDFSQVYTRHIVVP